MSITVVEYKNKETVEIQVMGSFDFSLFNDFRAAYADYIGNIRHFIVNLESVEYLDSAALGMLLSMRSAIGEGAEIEIVGANDFIRNILMISRFDKCFTIH